jgi:hypothetical protein
MDSGRDSYEEMGTFTGSNSTSALASSAASFAIFVASPLAVLGESKHNHYPQQKKHRLRHHR